MISRDAQSKLEIFKGALGNGKLDWATFIQLEDQQQDAIQFMLDKDILTIEKIGHYSIQTGIRKINSPARNLEHGPDKTPVYFKRKKQAEQVLKFYQDNNQKASLEKHINYQP